MQKLFILFLLLSVSAMAQDGVYDLVGFEKPSDHEVDTLYDDMFTYYYNKSRCMKEVNKIRSIQGGGSFGLGMADYSECGEDDLGMRKVEEPFRTILGAVNSTFDQWNRPSQANSTYMNRPTRTYQGRENGMWCTSRLLPGGEQDGNNFKEIAGGFKEEHLRLIDEGDNSLGKLEKYVSKACKIYGSTSSASQVVYSSGNAIRNIGIDKSYKEVMPLTLFSMKRQLMMERDYTGANSGGSHQGSDQVMNELEMVKMQQFYTAYDGNRFEGMMSSEKYNPNVMFRGSKEGNKERWREPENIGTHGVLLWHLCIGMNPDYKPEPNPDDNGDKEGDDPRENISMMNEKVQIILPDNVVSPFPLRVEDNKIVDVNLGDEEEFDLDRGPQFYGPRYSELDDTDKIMLESAGMAMRNKAKDFVESISNNPGETLDSEKSKFYIAACSNQLRNEPGFVNWSTNGQLERRNRQNGISFEELSNQRIDAQVVVMKALIKEQSAKEIADISEKLVHLNKTLSYLEMDDPQKVKLENRIAYLNHKKQMLTELDPSSIKLEKIGCGTEDNPGVAGPNPNFYDLKKEYPGMNLPQYNKNNPEANANFYIKLQQISKDVKEKDLKKKISEIQSALSNLGDSTSDKLKKDMYTGWLQNMQKMLNKEDPAPHYLDIPLSGVVSKYPCDMNYPTKDIKCSVSTQNSFALSSMKTEIFFAEAEMKEVVKGEGVDEGWKNEDFVVPNPGHVDYYYAALTCKRKLDEKPLDDVDPSCPQAANINDKKQCKKCDYEWLKSNGTGWEYCYDPRGMTPFSSGGSSGGNPSRSNRN